MAKRCGKDFRGTSSPAKRSRIVDSRGESVADRTNSDDVWGDDFDDDAIVEMDFIASQACSQVAAAVVDPKNGACHAGRDSREPAPSTSRAPPRRERPLPTANYGVGRGKFGRAASQTLSSSENLGTIDENDIPAAFDDFKTNLLHGENLNSTFRPKNDVVLISDEASLRRLEKLEQDNKKLMDDFMIKEGETVFLRSQLQQTQLRAENEKVEKARFIEEQASRHRSELDALHREKENLKTLNEFQALQLATLMEKCKMLESGAIKFTQPQRAVAASETQNRAKLANLNRSVLGAKTVRVSETSVQTRSVDEPNRVLKTRPRDHPLERVPRSIFEPSLPEKSVVEIQIIEKIGKKNLPILQEEDTFRIFENPVLVKPIVTIVDGRRLNVEFFLPDVAAIMTKTSVEINSDDCTPIINRIVSTTRELLLNSTMVLQTIFAAMKNDDIRDMNDLYFSDFYDDKIERDRSICESKLWYEKERGIEARRSMGVLSYVAEASDYLCRYIAGETRLMVEEDVDYSNYNAQMIRYGAWTKKNHNFELLEMILEFVTALGLVRRSHQFSGLICAIARTLRSVEQRVGFSSKGLEYASDIFREIVFSRPLLRCFPSITKMMATFCKSRDFARRLCFSRSNMKIWNGVLHFTMDACPLEIYMAQIERFRFDAIATIDTCDDFLSMVHRVILVESIPWITEAPNSCNCCLRVLSYAITLLCGCSRIHLPEVERSMGRGGGGGGGGSGGEERAFAIREHHFWRIIRRKQRNSLKKGIRFLCYLAKREPDFILRISDIEDSFHLFMQRVGRFQGLALHENEQEALAMIKLTLSPERPAIMESRSQQSKFIFAVRSAFEEKPLPSPFVDRWYEVDGKGSSHRAIAAYRDVLEGATK